MIFLMCGRMRSMNDSPPICTAFGGSAGLATGFEAGGTPAALETSLSAMGGRGDVAPGSVARQFAPLDCDAGRCVARRIPPSQGPCETVPTSDRCGAHLGGRDPAAERGGRLESCAAPGLPSGD